MQRALISILIPFKNTERFLEECLRSIQKQSYTNWELHIVDDHSSDRSTEIVESYANKFLKHVNSIEEALEGAQDIMAEWISERTVARDIVRKHFQHSAMIKSKVIKGKDDQESK